VQGAAADTHLLCQVSLGREPVSDIQFAGQDFGQESLDGGIAQGWCRQLIKCGHETTSFFRGLYLSYQRNSALTRKKIVANLSKLCYILNEHYLV
jgi:hypothetical protein